MAKKSKTQKAKASAARQARKAEREQEEAIEKDQAAPSSTSDEGSEKKGIFKKADKPEKAKEPEASKKIKKADDKPKKKRFQFFRDVKSELKRVTWPTKTDVMRWSGVVVVALLFFGVFVAVLDNLVITPLLILISGADPSSIDWGSVFTGGDFSTDGSSGADASSADVSEDASADAGADASADAGADASADAGAETDASADEAQADIGSEG